MKFYYTYVLKSSKNGKLYVGWTNDLKKRIKRHKSGKVTATKGRLPFSLIYYEACLSKRADIAREKQLKTSFGRSYLNRRLGLE